MPPTRRTVAALGLGVAATLAFLGGIGLKVLREVVPHWTVGAPDLLVLAACAFGVLSAAVASGSRVKRRWVLGAAALAALPSLMSASPAAPEIAGWASTPPGAPVTTAVVMSAITAVVALSVAAPIALPAKGGAGCMTGRTAVPRIRHHAAMERCSAGPSRADLLGGLLDGLAMGAGLAGLAGGRVVRGSLSGERASANRGHRQLLRGGWSGHFGANQE